MKKFFSWQLRLCRSFDGWVFDSFSHDGNTAFASLVPEIIPDGSSLADVGGGKTPLFNVEEVERRGLKVTGVDIDANELNLAPAGAYANVIVSPLEECRGNNDHDFVVAQSVLEHVNDGALSMQGIASLLRPGGRVVTFCPNRRAWFARLNLLLSEDLKRKILFFVFPQKRERQGFPAHYSGCTPGIWKST